MISIKKASEITGQPERTLRHWCQNNDIKAIKLGRAWIIDLTEKQLKKVVAILCR
jgi:hypothetical protein